MDTRGWPSSAATDEMAAESIPKAEEAVGHYRRLAETTADTHLPGLATSLHNLACMRRDGGRHEHALAPAQEAVTIYRRLAEIDPDTHLYFLAGRS